MTGKVCWVVAICESVFSDCKDTAYGFEVRYIILDKIYRILSSGWRGWCLSCLKADGDMPVARLNWALRWATLE